MEDCAVNINQQQLMGTYKGKQSFLKVLVNTLVKIKNLTSKNEELNSLVAAQKRILSILAHDLRNPLASIKNILDFKQAEILSSDEAGEMLTLVKGQLTSTIDVVDNVVNWGKLHLRALQLNFDDFNLHQLVDTIFESELLSARAKNNKLVNLVGNNTLINSDKHILEFILRNLVSNANKFTENGTITVSMLPGIKTILQVTDTGVGMPRERAGDLFEENNHGPTPGTKNEKGSGLGLLLVKEFITRLNGTITVESELNKGTRFILEF